MKKLLTLGIATLAGLTLTGCEKEDLTPIVDSDETEVVEDKSIEEIKYEVEVCPVYNDDAYINFRTMYMSSVNTVIYDTSLYKINGYSLLTEDYVKSVYEYGIDKDRHPDANLFIRSSIPEGIEVYQGSQRHAFKDDMGYDTPIEDDQFKDTNCIQYDFDDTNWNELLEAQLKR